MAKEIIRTFDLTDELEDRLDLPEVQRRRNEPTVPLRSKEEIGPLGKNRNGTRARRVYVTEHKLPHVLTELSVEERTDKCLTIPCALIGVDLNRK
ncbi:MAG: hypothetical protein JWQ87_1024 [Candidatus Sulfotelmatobacter sp.]|nr:hypothetical protein [Candidatus Sulfotelmatobacter sp.]